MFAVAYQECTLCLGRGRTGPALFFKQGAVCALCNGERVLWQVGGWSTLPCHGCQPLDHSAVRKGCPELYVPGHGTRSWAQFPEGW